MDMRTAHLQMLQAVIGRMANASLLFRGWAITLVAGVFALSKTDTDRLFFLLAYFPILAFWVLDGYYLSRERAFRDLYDAVRVKKTDEEVDFSMDISKSKRTWIEGCFSKPTMIFYGVLVACTLALMFGLPIKR